MIKVNDLRIGNLVKICNSDFCQTSHAGKIVEVESINYSGINVSEEYGSCVADYVEANLEPIELTDEILAKYENDEAVYRLEKSEADGYHVEIIGEGWVSNLIIYYLHQYQNVHYILTGDELETSDSNGI